ncbi:MAG: hypothetical protein D6706_16400 [Chloroflexi bacterium]|nr:MAG: hypothetical protein D6706_16400 [Chloroflexota bacterium]
MPAHQPELKIIISRNDAVIWEGYPDGYNHTIQAVGGDWQARIKINGDGGISLSAWLNAIGADVTVYAKTDVIWRGVVDTVTTTNGRVSVTNGSLFGQMTNRVRALYQTVRYNTNPPIGGQPVQTDWLDDKTSQDIYGILEQIVNGGEALSSEIDNLLATILKDRAYPKRSVRYNSSGAGETVSVNIEAKGYVHYLTKKMNTAVIDSTANTAIQTLLDLVTLPNNVIFSYNLEENSYQIKVNGYEGNRTIWDEIRRIVAVGSTNGNKYLFQFKGTPNGITAVYRQVNNTPQSGFDYHLKPDGELKVFGSNDPVPVHNIRAGRWLLVDTDTGEIQAMDASIRLRSNAVFVESVQYTMPDSVQISGGTPEVSTMLMARMGLGGV